MQISHADSRSAAFTEDTVSPTSQSKQLSFSTQTNGFLSAKMCLILLACRRCLGAFCENENPLQKGDT